MNHETAQDNSEFPETGMIQQTQDFLKKKLPSVDPDEEVWDRQLFEAVVAKLSTIVSETSYRVFVMRLIEQRSTADVAAAVGLAEEQVRARYHRAHQKLRTMVSLFNGSDFGNR